MPENSRMKHVVAMASNINFRQERLREREIDRQRRQTESAKERRT